MSILEIEKDCLDYLKNLSNVLCSCGREIAIQIHNYSFRVGQSITITGQRNTNGPTSSISSIVKAISSLGLCFRLGRLTALLSESNLISFKGNGIAHTFQSPAELTLHLTLVVL